MQSADSAHENGFTNAETEADVKRMETLIRYIISSLKSGRSSVLLDIIVGLLYPVLSLQCITLGRLLMGPSSTQPGIVGRPQPLFGWGLRGGITP
ncbi:proteasome activator subunit 4-like [Ananas comosus]|uniref:Proteasome activator subunit 4-like n=1 Tax=Ananas comosus TaxID=4615 RepID=A0A6P5GXU7_ANACO|nr:proteasome activator subunit 4-like [Ananas comosus]